MSVSISDLDKGTTYFWQVRSIKNGVITEANDGFWWSFLTSSAFSKISPEDNAKDQTTSITLSWEPSLGAESYEYCYDSLDDSTCNGGWFSTGTNASTSISDLENNTTYYWQVRLIKKGVFIEANDGNWWRFNTEKIESYENITYLPTIMR